MADRRRMASPGTAKSKRVDMALIPEDRKTEGLMLPMSVRDNLSFAALDRLTRFGIVDRGRRAPRDRRDDPPAPDQRGRDQRAGERALRRQPAEGGDRQVADEPAAHHPPQRSHPRHRRRNQAGALSAACAGSPTSGAAILFYSTDYDELVGSATGSRSCTTAGSSSAAHGRRDHRSRRSWRARLNIGAGSDRRPGRSASRMTASRYLFSENKGTIAGFRDRRSRSSCSTSRTIRPG